MNWDDLRMFLAVARGESLARAGRMLRVDAATVGRRISRLERALGVRLFLRSQQGYALTEAGERLFDRAVAAERAMEGAVAGVRAGEEGLTGTVRIGAPDGCANYVLPRITRRIAAANPGLTIQILALPRVFNLSRREADMAITVSPPEAGRLVVQKITPYHLHLVASEEWLATHGPIESRADLAGHRVVGYIPDMIFDRELDYLDVIGPDIRPDLASNSVPVQLAWLSEGGGIGIAHDFALPCFPRLRRILPAEIALERHFYLVRHADDRLSERDNRLAALIADGIRAEIARLEAQVARAEALARAAGPGIRPL